MSLGLEEIWIGIGFAGQGLFTARFLVQWIASERQRQSVIPVVFWYFSLAGGSVLLSYAIWRGDPVFIVGQGAGLIVYIRNLYFIHINGSEAEANSTPSKRN